MRDWRVAKDWLLREQSVVTPMTPERWREVDAGLSGRARREEPDRAAFLAEIGARYASLRAEVDALLAHDRPAEKFLKTPAMEVAAHALARASDTIATGHVIGGYTILSRLGAGGMGEVYRARDTKLGREVAIKILPRLFAADPERLARFEREARMLASLNHPHIAAIYGLEDMDGYASARPRAGRGRDAGRADRRAGRSPLAEALTIAQPDRRSARSRAREGHRPPRSEARQHQDHARRRRQGARLRSGEGGCGQRAGSRISRNRRPSRSRRHARGHDCSARRPT